MQGDDIQDTSSDSIPSSCTVLVWSWFISDYVIRLGIEGGSRTLLTGNWYNGILLV